MPLPIPASELAVGDWSESQGTIKEYIEHRDRKTNELQSVDITFWNGHTATSVDPDAIFYVVQGGLNDRPPTSTIRPGFEADHARE